MIVLDRREPEDLETAVRRLGVPVCRAIELPFGDCQFSGNGPDGECMVGFERKRLGDLITSMKDRRLSGHQLRGCWQAFEFVYLVSEGIYREGSGGEIEELRFNPQSKKQEWTPYWGSSGADGHAGGRSAISYEQLDHYLCTLELKGGVIVKRTKDMGETARFYVSRWRWFNHKRWADHKSHDQLYTGTPAKAHGSGWGRPHLHDREYEGIRGRAQMVQELPTTAWRCAAQFPGIDNRASTIARHFRTLQEMSLAGLDPELKARVIAWFAANPKAALRAWQAVDFGEREDGKKNPGIGPVTAAAVVRAITTEGA